MNIPGERPAYPAGEGKNPHSGELMRPPPIDASAGTGSGFPGQSSSHVGGSDTRLPVAAKAPWRGFWGEDRRQQQRRQQRQAVLLDTRLHDRRVADQGTVKIRCAI